MTWNRNLRSLTAFAIATASLITLACIAIPAVAAQDADGDRPPQTKSDAPAADALPPADEILDGYVEATGGKKAYEKLKTRHARGTFEIESLGVKGKIETWQQAPDKLCTITDMGDFGRSERGCDGKNAWEIRKSPMQELLGGESGGQCRLLEGDEKAYLLREATFNADLHWRGVAKAAETVGEEIVGSQPAWKIKITTRDGQELTHYYDKYSKLLVRVDATIKTEMGQVAVEVYPADYEKVNGVLVPFKSIQKMMGITQIAIFESIEFNVTIGKHRFEPPEGARKLLSQRKGNEAKNGKPR